MLFQGKEVVTGIFKELIKGHVKLRKLNLDGDRQADLTVHGGPDKAVYAYPVEHYDYWKVQLPDTVLPWSMFGENLTTEGILEDMFNIGDQFQIGSARVMMTQPRMPCYKLGVRFGRTDIIRKFLVSGRPGFYFRVLKEGEVGAVDPIELISRDKNNITVKDIVRLYVHDKEDIEAMRRASKLEALPEEWRDHFCQQLNQIRM